MNEKYILDENGQPVICDDLYVWADWFETSPTRRLASTQIGEVFISTVFLGLDHNFAPVEDPLTYQPILWETMIFGGRHNQQMWRYTSREAAELGHAEACALAQQGVDEDAAALRELLHEGMAEGWEKVTQEPDEH